MIGTFMIFFTLLLSYFSIYNKGMQAKLCNE